MLDEMINESFNRFKILCGNEEIKITEFEKVIFKRLKKEEGNNICVIPKDNKYLIVLSIIYNSLYYCLNNLYDNDIDILDIIKQGDLVEYSKSIAVFKGIENENIKLQFKDGILMFKVKDRYKLSKYNGDVKKIKKMPIKGNRGTKKKKSLLAEILGLEVDELCKVNKNSILIIANKDIIFELMKTVRIKIGEEEVAFTEIFPCTYYSSLENSYDFRGNSKKEESLIKFVSKTYLALDIVKRNKGINNILYMPSNVSDEDLFDIIDLNKRKNIYSCRTIVSPIDIEKYIDCDFIKEDFKLSYFNLSECLKVSEKNKLRKKQITYIENFNLGKLEEEIIRSEQISNLRKTVNYIFIDILKYFKDDDVLNIIILGRKIIRSLVNLIIPLEEYNKLIHLKYEKNKSIDYMLNEFNRLIESIKVRNLSEDLLGKIIESADIINKLYNIIDINNYKWNQLKSILLKLKDERTTVIIEDEMNKDITKIYLKSIFPHKYNLYIEKKSKAYKFSDNIIVTSKFKKDFYWDYRRYETNRCIRLFYEFESYNYFYLKNKFEKFLNINLNDNSTKIMNRNTDINDDNSGNLIRNKILSDNQLDDEIEKLIAINYIPKDLKCDTCNSRYTNTRCEKIILFSDGRKAFLTKQYYANILNFSKEELERKEISELRIGDIMVFIDGIEKDLVDFKIQQLMNIEEFRDKFLKQYNLAKQWKKDLENYREINNMTYEDLANEFKANGIKRDKVTIRAWLTDSIVGPQDELVYKAITKILGYKYQDYMEIYNSCNNIRSLQIKIRKIIAKNILEISLNDGDDYIDKIIGDNVLKGIEGFEKLEIANIYNIRKEVPWYIVNKIIEG